jgi:hypothetical protein
MPKGKVDRMAIYRPAKRNLIVPRKKEYERRRFTFVE